MKVSILTRYGRSGASSRLRFMQYVPALEAAGMTVEVLPFFPDDYLPRLYAGRSTQRQTAAAFLRQVRNLMGGAWGDLLWVEKEILPWIPWAVERRLLPSHACLVTDYDDAIFHRYDLHPNSVVRWLLGRKIDRIMASSALVMAGNPYLAARAREAGARRVEIVPTVVDAAQYGILPRQTPLGQPCIGWIGTPSTWREYLVPIMPMLTDVARSFDARLRIVGGGLASPPHPLVENLPWTESGEIKLIQSMDIGIMPLSAGPWSSGKCGYKLIQYMACGLPVIASPVGVNTDIVEDGVNGFLADSEQAWRVALARLLSDEDLRTRMGRAGRKKVESSYSLEVQAPHVVRLLREALDDCGSQGG